MYKKLFLILSITITLTSISMQDSENYFTTVLLTKADIDKDRAQFTEWVKTNKPPRFQKLYLLLSRLPLYLLHSQKYMENITIKDISYSMELMNKFYAPKNITAHNIALQKLGSDKDLKHINAFYSLLLQNEHKGNNSLVALDRVRDYRRSVVCEYLGLNTNATKEELKNSYERISLDILFNTIALDQFNTFLFKQYSKQQE